MNIVWQGILAGTIAVAAVAVLLAVGALRRRGGVVLARVGVAVAAASAVVAPVGAAIARPSVALVRITSFGADGTARWTVSPHLVDASAVRAGATGTIIVDGDSPSGLCNANPTEVTLAAGTGRTVAEVADGNDAGAPFGGPNPEGILVNPQGGPGNPSAQRAPDAKVAVGISYEDSGNGPPLELLQATDIGTGVIRWQLPVQSASVGPAPLNPLWVDSHVVIAATTANQSSGVFGVGVPDQSTATTRITGRAPLVLGPGSTVVALDPSSGAERWHVYLGADSPVVVGAGPAGVAVATSRSLTLRDLDSGAIRATAALSAAPLTAFSPETGLVANPIVVGHNSVALLTTSSQLTSYGPALQRGWTRHVAIHGDRAAVQLIGLGNTIYLIDQTGDPTSGCY